VSFLILSIVNEMYAVTGFLQHFIAIIRGLVRQYSGPCALTALVSCYMLRPDAFIQL